MGKILPKILQDVRWKKLQDVRSKEIFPFIDFVNLIDLAFFIFCFATYFGWTSY